MIGNIVNETNTTKMITKNLARLSTLNNLQHQDSLSTAKIV